MYILSRNLLYRTNFILKEQRDTFFSKFHDQLKYINLIKLNGIDFTDIYNSVWRKYLNPGMGALDGEATFDEKKAGCRALSNYILWRLASSL